jgi:hypothetical protein
VSVTSGTIFDKTRVPMTVWFRAVWEFATPKTGVSAAHLRRMLPVNSYQTMWAMLSRLRSVVSTLDREPLSGRVEVDETLVGGPRSGRAGRGALGKTLLAGAIEVSASGWGRARLGVIPDASADSLRAFARANIAPGSTVVTDAWASYPSALEGYTHEPVNVSASGDPAHESLPAVHRLFALFKNMLAGAYMGGGSPDHLPGYADEFVFRFNRRHSRKRGMLFLRLLQRAVAAEPVTYRDLVRTPRPKQVHPTGVTGPRRTPGSLDIDPADRPWLPRR